SMIDDDKLNEFRELMGYYQIVTSELDLPDLEIIDKYHGLTRIEDQFREMKGTLETRPIFLSTQEHIQAHLLICFIALTMMRVIQYKITKVLPKASSTEQNWTYGLSGKRLSKALLNWEVDQIADQYYRMNHVLNDDLTLILRALDLSIPKKLFSRGDLRDLKAAAKVF
ncbi:MAG: hypothetical protein RSH26_02290, partial [Clostridia bacterium]